MELDFVVHVFFEATTAEDGAQPGFETSDHD
jgi:hypothetical protein